MRRAENSLVWPNIVAVDATPEAARIRAFADLRAQGIDWPSSLATTTLQTVTNGQTYFAVADAWLRVELTSNGLWRQAEFLRCVTLN